MLFRSVWVDFGGNVGGFTDCRRQHGAAKVYAIKTGYGVLDYRLRTDDRGVEMERMNVLHVLRAEDHPPSERAGFEGTLAEQRAAEALQHVLGRTKRGYGNVEYLVWARKSITSWLRNSV